MKKILFSLSYSLLLLLACGQEPPRKFKFATTLDFTGWAWSDGVKENPKYYPVELLEARIRELAQAGVKKIYLRVSVRGLTLYPSEVGVQYGTRSLYHWQDPAKGMRLAETLKRYDPCRELIRLGHQYGMEVWAWESVFEDGGLGFFVPRDPGLMTLARRYHFDAMSNPAFVDHPEYFTMRDPKLPDTVDESEMVELEKEALRIPIQRIELISRPVSRPIRFRREEIQIQTSTENSVWEPCGDDFTFTVGRTADGRNTIVIDRLKIRKPYIRLVHRKPYPARKADVTFSLPEQGEGCRIFNAAGEEIPATWGISSRLLPLAFHDKVSAAWDWGDRVIGLHVTKYPGANKYCRGLAELSVPAVMKHKIARFAELANYPFDGFMFNLRSHLHSITDHENYGYNRENRDLYRKRYGVDIWKEPADSEKLQQIRGEKLAEFFHECRKLTDGRPLWISGLPPKGWKCEADSLAMQSKNILMYKPFLSIPMLYDRYFADGSVDGVSMVGADFSDYLATRKSNGQPVGIGVFREGMILFRWPPKGYDIFEEVAALAKSGRYDEVEFYETWYLTPGGRKSNLEKLKRILK